MLVAFHTQDAAGHSIPQLTGCDAVSGQVNARGNPEPGIAENRSRQIVRKYLGPNRSQRNRRGLLCFPELGIDFLWRVGHVVAECGQTRVEHAGLGGVDGHGMFVERKVSGRPNTDRSISSR